MADYRGIGWSLSEAYESDYSFLVEGSRRGCWLLLHSEDWKSLICRQKTLWWC